jgi:cytochrome c-type biogenesis protein CcmE
MKQSIKSRLLTACILLGSLGGLIFILSTSFRDTLVFFFTPSEILEKTPHAQQVIRLGGMVKKDSVQILSQQHYQLQFILSDLHHNIPVRYQGFLPDLFREGQGVVAEGTYDAAANLFIAKRLFAKHDETYKPPDNKGALAKTTQTSNQGGGSS